MFQFWLHLNHSEILTNAVSGKVAIIWKLQFVGIGKAWDGVKTLTIIKQNKAHWRQCGSKDNEILHFLGKIELRKAQSKP